MKGANKIIDEEVYLILNQCNFVMLEKICIVN